MFISIRTFLSFIKRKILTKTYNDDFLRWLQFANAGMLEPGNIYSIKYAIERLPTNDPIIEIGSFCGLSTNVICYFLKTSKKENHFFCSDKWIFEGAEQNGLLGESDVTHKDYRSYVKESFMKNISLFSKKKPFPIELFSDEFFEKWSSEKLVNDIFGRKVRLGGKISFFTLMVIIIMILLKEILKMSIIF